ncbi:MAG: FAD-binding oxidoreductase, partial [Lachnospiraceae bacterium]|nr:FAD-binding oxidoreductase [Lachnospiraceae bacterium]
KKDNGTPVNYSDTVPCICRGIIRYIPMLKDAKIVRAWAGWSDNMKDGVPIIDTVSEVPGLILACGFTGHGFGIAPGVGTVVSQLVAGEEPVCDISGLKYDRFYAKDIKTA